MKHAAHGCVAAATPPGIVPLPIVVDRATLLLSLNNSLPLPLDRAPLLRTFNRLHAGKPLIVTSIGQSNTVGEGGCFGARGCGATPANSRFGWGAAWMAALNATWPADHQLFNRGFGASNPHGVTTCLASHLAPHTDILTVDFNLMGWTAPEQERLARTVAMMARPPLVVFLGFPYFCPVPDPRVVEEQKRVVQARAPPGKTINVRLEAEREACRADLRAGRFRQDDAVAERLSVVARHYGAVQIKLLDTVAPLIRSGHANFSPPLIFTEDGIHGSWKPNRKHPQARSPYYEAISRMLDAFVREAYAGVERGPGWGRVGSSAVPSQVHAEAGRRFPDTCYEWHHPNMPPPPVVAGSNVTATKKSWGWYVSEYTLQAQPRRKPGLLSLVRGDAIDLALAVRADGAERGTKICVGLTFLRSYEGVGAASLSCVAPCACDATSLDGLDPRARASLFHTTEVAATVGADAAACVVRLRNLGPSANATTGRGASKFRLSGVYVRRSHSCDEAVTEGWWGLAQNMKHSSGLAKVPEWMMQGKPSS